MSLETPQSTPHPVDHSDPVILSKSPDDSSPVSPIISAADFACLLDSQALGESILKRHLTDLNARPEPPTTEAVTCAILSLRRTTNNRRMLMLMINPDAFRRTPRTNPDDPDPYETPRAWRHTKTAYPDPYSSSDPVDPLDPVILSRKSPSDFSNSSFAIRNSPPPIAVHANPYLLNPNADDEYDPNDGFDIDGINDDLDPGLDADLISDPSDSVNPSSDPVILSKNSSSADSAPLRENSSSSSASQSLFGLSPEASKTVASILETCHKAPRKLRPVPEKYEGMTIEEYNAYCDFNDSGSPMDYLKPEVAAHNKRFTDYLFRDRSLDPNPEAPNPANPSPNPAILSKSSPSANSAPLREKSAASNPLLFSVRTRAGPY